MIIKPDSKHALVMHRLETQDAQQRNAPLGTFRREAMLLQVPPGTGRLLAWMIGLAPANGALIEIGTSAGYSSLWLVTGLGIDTRRLHTWETDGAKARLAAETFSEAGVEQLVQLHEGDPCGDVAFPDQIAFCFLDCWNPRYNEIYRLVAPRLVPGGILAADNVQSHESELADFVALCEGDTRMDCMVLPVDSGILLARKKS